MTLQDPSAIPPSACGGSTSIDGSNGTRAHSPIAATPVARPRKATGSSHESASTPAVNGPQVVGVDRYGGTNTRGLLATDFTDHRPPERTADHAARTSWSPPAHPTPSPPPRAVRSKFTSGLVDDKPRSPGRTLIQHLAERRGTKTQLRSHPETRDLHVIQRERVFNGTSVSPVRRSRLICPTWLATGHSGNRFPLRPRARRAAARQYTSGPPCRSHQTRPAD